MKLIEDTNDFIIKELDSKQAEHMVSYTLEDPIITDKIILVTAKNKIHAKSLVEHLSLALKERFIGLDQSEFYEYPLRSGDVESGWVLLDLNAITIHIVTEDVRRFYELDLCFEGRGTAYHH